MVRIIKNIVFMSCRRSDFHMHPLIRCARTACFGALLILSACGSPKEQEAKYVAHGKELYESGDLIKATLEFKNALQINPAGVEAQYYLGMIAEKRHDFPAALSAYQKAADEDPHHFEAHLKVGQFALMSGDADTANNYAKQLLEMAPNKPEGHNLKAAVFLMQGKLPEAEAEANAALALDPENVDALVILAGRQARDSKFPEALAFLERGLKTHPDNKDLLLVKLKVMYDQKRTSDVIAVLRRLHEVDPATPSYVIDLANELAADNRLDEAEAVYKEALAANQGSDDLMTAFAGFLVAKKNLDQAIAEIKTLTDQSKKAPKYMLLLEQLYLKAGKLDPAAALMTDLQTNGAAESDRLRAQVELARITLLRGDKPAALDQLNTVITQDSSNAEALLLRGAIMLTDSKFDNVISDARAILHGNPNSVGALMLLSKAYIATGEGDLAIDTLRSLLRVAPSDVDAHLELASLLAAKSPDDALDQLDAAIALRPKATELKVQKAEFLIRTGSPDKAEIIGQDFLKDAALSAVGHRIMGEAALARTDYPTAIAELTQAEAQGQPFESVGPMLVNAYVRAGKVSDAVALLTDRVSKDPSAAKPLVMLAQIRMQAGDAKGAEDFLHRAISAQPESSEAYLALAQILTKEHKLEDAAKILTAAQAKIPNDKNVLTFAAITYDSMNDFTAAKAGYESILAKWPDNLVAANNLAALIADAWPKDEAQLDQARQLTEKFRNTSDPILLDTLGWVLVRQGSFDDAAILLEKAASSAPDNQQIQYHYAVALNSKGLKEKAKEAFGKALAGNPDYRGVADAKQLAASLN
jgi:tetratricopeptide (TPR) repeat protein